MTTDPTPAALAAPNCTHIRVSYRTKDIPYDGPEIPGSGAYAPLKPGMMVTRGWWECDSGCGTTFLPVSAPPTASAPPREEAPREQQNDLGKTENDQQQEPVPSRDVTGVLYQGAPFSMADVFHAYITGARSAREHHPASDTLIERSADAYVKHALIAERY